MKSNIETFRSFRFWTILVPLVATATALIASSTLWVSPGMGTTNTPPLSLLGYSIFCAFITACFALLHFYGNAWVDSYENPWVGSSYSERILDKYFSLTESLDWRLRNSVSAVATVILWTSPIGLLINVTGVGVAIIRAITLILVKACEFLWSCRPGVIDTKAT